jgi:hypothetical protein
MMHEKIVSIEKNQQPKADKGKSKEKAAKTANLLARIDDILLLEQMEDIDSYQNRVNLTSESKIETKKVEQTPMDVDNEIVSLGDEMPYQDVQEEPYSIQAFYNKHVNLVNDSKTEYDELWIIDSRASHHVTNELRDFTSYKPYATPEKIQTANMHDNLMIVGKGTVFFNTKTTNCRNYTISNLDSIISTLA